MARLLSQFNAKDNEKMGDFTPVPPAEYVAQIIESELKETKAKDGTRLVLKFQIMDGEFNGKTIYDSLNIQNKNSQTVEIAQKALASICEACGIDMLTDSEELHNKPMLISVSVKPATAQYSAQNQIKGYKEYGSPATAPSTESSSAGDKTPPWKK